MIEKSYEKNARNKGAKYGEKEEDTYISRRSSSSAKPPIDLFVGGALVSSAAALTKAS
jgi:hypothetical protein